MTSSQKSKHILDLTKNAANNWLPFYFLNCTRSEQSNFSLSLSKIATVYSYSKTALLGPEKFLINHKIRQKQTQDQAKKNTKQNKQGEKLTITHLLAGQLYPKLMPRYPFESPQQYVEQDGKESQGHPYAYRIFFSSVRVLVF